MLGKNSEDDIQKLFSYFSQKIGSEISKPISGEKKYNIVLPSAKIAQRLVMVKIRCGKSKTRHLK